MRRAFLLTGFLAASSLLNAGCTAFLATSQDFYYQSEFFPARRPAAEVVVFADGSPAEPYVVLGRVVATQGIFGSRDAVLDELRRKAAKLGADALMEVRTESGAASPEGAAGGGTKQTRFAQAGNISTSESWIPAARGSIRLSISGLAVRYRTP